MKLPNANSAKIDIAKLENYCLDENHPRGKHKAKVFRSALGLTAAGSEELKKVILEEILKHECGLGESDKYGSRYTVDFHITKSGSSALVRTSWIIKSSENSPCLTSCYVL